MFNPVQAPQIVMLRAIETMAHSAGVRLTPAGVSDSAEIERAIDAFARESDGGLTEARAPATVIGCIEASCAPPLVMASAD